MTFYHGTKAGFRKGGLLLPPNKTGHTEREVNIPEGWPDDRKDHVYFTTSLDLAWSYAITAPGRGKPKVLIVFPWGDIYYDRSLVNGEERNDSFYSEAALVEGVIL